jgi:molecular chaperone GrpE
MNIPENKEKKDEEVEYIPQEKEEVENDGALQKAAVEEPASIKPSGNSPETPRPEHDKEDVTRLKGKIKKHDSEIQKLRKEKDEMRDQLLRKLADMENLRKRLEREKSDFLQFALSDILLELVGILDNFERALNTPEQGTDCKTFREGVELIYRMLQSLLFKKGVQLIEIKDRFFDPNVHHAMATEESDEVQEPEVGEEFQKGYMLNNRLLRPSLVKVIVPKKS